jgi:uracil-DNA glycosylase family 4
MSDTLCREDRPKNGLPMTEPHAEAAAAADLADLDRRVVRCRACPRLVAWRELVARDKRAAYASQEYWGRPVPGFGPTDARLALVGLAPSAHGANRTGRMFTGDRSGDVLFAALHAAGLASSPSSTDVDDGTRLHDLRMFAPVRCAPPDNKPSPAERDACRPWLVRELELLAPTLRAIIVLGGFGWQALLPVLAETGWSIPRPRPVFAHGAQVVLSGRSNLHLFGCYHVSPQNTNTGRLTPAMLADVLTEARQVADRK